jgi:hypothetical protein
MINVIKYAGTCATPQDINAHADKLTFNTREEYFKWVKQWKEEYNNVVLHYRAYKLFSRSHTSSWNGKAWVCTPLASKKALYRQAKQKELEAQTTMKEDELVAKLTERIKNEYNYVPQYSRYSFYTLLQYMLGVRRASKIRAAKKREERLAHEKEHGVAPNSFYPKEYYMKKAT